MKNLKWILIFLLLCIACALFYIIKPHRDARAATITSNGKVIKVIDLNTVTEPYEFTVENNGWNTIRVEKGKIAVTDADCSDRICVNQGYIENGALPIVCLPHRLVITVSGDGEFDAVAGGQ